jgi:DNA-binding PadR family transcriptional regulator
MGTICTWWPARPPRPLAVRDPPVPDKRRGKNGLRLEIYRLSVYKDGVSQRPLQEPAFLILTALAGGAQHGYGIMTDAGQISGGRVRLRAGTLYAALDRLGGDGLVEVDHEEVVDGRLRRYYRLTEAGAQRLAAEVDRLRANATAAARRLGLIAGTP